MFPFLSLHGWMITYSIKCRMKLHIQSQTSRAQPFKSGMERKCNSKLYKVCFTHQPWDYSHSMLVKGTPDCGTITLAATVMKTLQVFLRVSYFLNGVTGHFQFWLTIWSSNFLFWLVTKSKSRAGHAQLNTSSIRFIWLAVFTYYQTS